MLVLRQKLISQFHPTHQLEWDSQCMLVASSLPGFYMDKFYCIYDTKAHLERWYLLCVGPQNSRTKEDTFIYNTWSCLTYMYEG